MYVIHKNYLEELNSLEDFEIDQKIKYTTLLSSINERYFQQRYSNF